MLFADSLRYATVKQAVLRAYELMPEAYRQKFRGRVKSPSQTHVKFAEEKSLLLDRWCSANKVSDYAELREPLLLAQFK